MHCVEQDDFSYEKYVYLADTQTDCEDADYDAFDELDERIARKRIKQAENILKKLKDSFSYVCLIDNSQLIYNFK